MRWLDVEEARNRVTGQILADQAEHLADAPFLLFDDERISFGDANERSNSIANGLRDLGVGRGATVALLMENSPEMVLATFAVNKLGAVWTPTNTAYRGDWLRHTFEDGGAEVLIVDSEHLDRVAELGRDLPFKHVVVRGDASSAADLDTNVSSFMSFGAHSTRDPGVEVEPRDLASVMWTSGTTGRSKGVMQTHSTWLTCSDVICRGRDTGDGDVFYCCVPMYNSGGWVLNIYDALLTGLPVGIERQFSASAFWDRCRHFGATQIFTLGAMHMYLWQTPESETDHDNPVRVGGLVPIPSHLMEPFKERFGLEYVWQGFGQSEVMPWTITHKGRAAKPGSCGLVREDLEVKILDEDDREVAVGEVGEVCVRPAKPDVMFSGYFGRPEATLAVFRNLWYHSGDLGRFDEDGELFFVDRKADFMRYKGRNISSFEVESVVARHPAVAEVAAHGVQAAELDTEDEVKVCVVLIEGATASADELARFVNDNAPYYMVPRYIDFVDELPHTPTGKIQKFLLRTRPNDDATWDRDASGFVVKR